MHMYAHLYIYIYIYMCVHICTYTPPKGLQGFTPVGPRPTERVLSTHGNANKELFVHFAEKSWPKPWKVVQRSKGNLGRKFG